MTANCIPLTSTDNQANNGVVHLVDGVLKPVEDSIADIVSKNPQLGILKTSKCTLKPAMRWWSFIRGKNVYKCRAMLLLKWSLI